ncbi:MAG: protoheme IX farnesyltransferase [Anaerolineae bacterium]|jgi:heme o synthase|nr:protoheme IX farnesyltransferase [Anaerolineae bacterium]MBT7076011.1 protoheme IX farnesyltransferase [Anaerolineae bacterium]MBT7782585.1 protoheme IX farnesyltransferase [Anaerolineae bacterium]
MNSQETTSEVKIGPQLSTDTLKDTLRSIAVLFKLRVVILLVLSSLGGAFLAAGGRISLANLGLLLVTGILSASGASAINQYLERSSDALMRRTLNRPLAAGLVSNPHAILGIASGLIALAVGIALYVDNLALAFFLALGAAIYIGIYTVWLKPRTLLNIVIGGAAGSCAVLSGSALVGNWAEPGALTLALLIFVWTPTHFWSLAMAYRDDYSRAGIPMLPTVVSDRATAWWITLHTGATSILALLLAFHPQLGLIYLIPITVATLWMGSHSIRLITHPDQKQAFKVFKVSNIYLGIALIFIYVETLI